MHSAMKIEVLYTKKCRRWPEIVIKLQRALQKLGLEAEIVTHEIKDLEEAKRLGFLGSPTVKVNGQDLEPQASGAPHLA